MTTGRYFQNFRTGDSSATATEAIWRDLNDAFGSALRPEEDTILGISNFVLARVLADWFDSVERFKNQSDPRHMTVSIGRWEKILGIVPPADASDEDRRQAIAAKFRMFNVAPTDQAVKDYLHALIPELILDIIRPKAADAIGAIPGGLSVIGGVSLPDGSFQSSVCYIAIRVHRPLNMTEQEYRAHVQTYIAPLSDFLPAHVLFKHGRYCYSPPGTITVAAGSASVVGTSTVFEEDPSGAVLSPGAELEVFDDQGRIQRLKIDTINSDALITLQTPAATAITDKKFKIKGFMLDNLNLDNAFLT